MGSVGIRVAVGQGLISPASRRTLLQRTRSSVPDQLVSSRSSSSVQRQSLAMAAASNLSIGKSTNIDMMSGRRIAATSKNSIVTRSGNLLLMSGDGNPGLASVVKLRAYASSSKAGAEAGVASRYMLRNPRLQHCRKNNMCLGINLSFPPHVNAHLSRANEVVAMDTASSYLCPLPVSLVCKIARNHHLYEYCGSDILHNHGPCLYSKKTSIFWTADFDSHPSWYWRTVNSTVAYIIQEFVRNLQRI